MAEKFVTSRRVEFCETDAAGIIHFSSFFCYMEQAEHAFLRSLGTSVMDQSPGSDRLTWPRVRAECEFLEAVRFEDVLEIALQISRIGNKSVTYEFNFWSQSAKLVARGTLVAVCCRRLLPDAGQLQSDSIPESLREKMAVFFAEATN